MREAGDLNDRFRSDLSQFSLKGEDELRSFLRKRIADYKVPEHVAFMPVLPKGLTGKVHRAALKDMFLASSETIKR